jgi:spermidine/putrescine transport system substrate-binding protein
MWGNRKIFLFVFVCLCVGFMVANPAHSSSKKFEGQTLVIGIWSGPWAESFKQAIGDPFEKMTGAKIAYKFAWDFTPEIMAAPADQPPLDIAETADSDFVVGVQNKLWLPINWDKVSNHKKINRHFWNDIAWDTTYGVPFSISVHVLLYRADLLKKPVLHWKELLTRDDLKGKIAIERWFPYWVYIGSYLTDYSPSTKAIYSKEGRNAILGQMKKLSNRWFFCYDAGAKLVAALDSGEVVVGNFWNGSSTKLYMEHKEKGKAGKYGVTFPEEGSVAYRDQFCVVRGTKKRELAETFLNWMISTEAQKAFSNTQYAIIVNQEAVASCPDFLKEKGLQPQKDADWDRFDMIDAKFLEPLRKELEERFMKEVLAK